VTMYTSITDLSADIAERLGLPNDDLLRSAVRLARSKRYETIDNLELDRMLRAVWAELIGTRYPFLEG
jgi:hypothetical protein